VDAEGLVGWGVRRKEYRGVVAKKYKDFFLGSAVWLKG
jgi:hypothetical protein